MKEMRTLQPLKKAADGDAVKLLARFGQFELTDHGVYLNHSRKGHSVRERVCARLEVTAETRDEDGQNWGIELSWNDNDGRQHRWSVPMSVVVKQGTDLAEGLALGGLHIAHGKGPLLKKYITSVQPPKKVLNVRRSGWYTFKHGTPAGQNIFVLPTRVIGNTGPEEVALQQDAYRPTAFEVSGTLSDWQQEVSALCNGNPLLQFSVSVAFAAPLLELVGFPSGGFHLYGLSSSGKSTALKVAASVWGYDVQTWRTTDNALEDTAERHNSVLLPLDELSQVDARKAAEIAYMLGNGEGKMRLTQSILPQKKKTWRLLFLSTGEITLADHAETAGKKLKAGTEVRMVNIEADAGAGMGVFANIHGYATPSAFADRLKASSEAYRGTAGIAFIEYLIQHHGEVRAKLDALIKQFGEANVPDNAGGEVHRVAQLFAIVAAAGEVATDAGVTMWSAGASMEAGRLCFQSWLKDHPLGASDVEKGIEQIRAFLLANEYRFQELDTGTSSFPTTSAPTPFNRAGYRRSVENGGTEYLVSPEVFKNEVCKGCNIKKVTHELNRRGYLRRGAPDRLQVQQTIPGKGRAMRFYAIQSTIFDGAPTGAQDEDNVAGTGLSVAEVASADELDRLFVSG